MAFLFRKKNSEDLQWLTADQVAKLLQVDEEVVEELTKSGKLLATPKDSSLQYERAEVDRFMQSMNAQLDRRNANVQATEVNRRSDDRRVVNIACEIRIESALKKKNAIFKGVVRNLSEHGIYVEEMVMVSGSAKLEMDDAVLVKVGSLPLMDGKIVRTYGRRKEDIGKGFLGVGVYLHGISKEDMEKVKGLDRNTTQS
jgi:hypothetical protein